MARVLVVDDQANMRATTALILEAAGHVVREASGGEQALRLVAQEPVDVVLTDLRMAPMDGMTLVRRLRATAPAVQVVVMTAYGSVDSAVEALHLGAADYLQKPFSEEELLLRLERALEHRRLLSEVSTGTDEFRARYRLENLVGDSQALRDLIARLVRIAPTDATVLITGESGTGKELVARAIHANSARAERPFVPVNCAAISEQLLESELFGHGKGAFTGAVAARRGLLEEANGGTFFFDEVAETTPAFQAKLLRAIQEHEIRRVGENTPIQVDVRVIAATNVDLAQAVAEKRFREDLYYRLAVVPLRVPPLRERPEDVPILVQHFLDRYNARHRTRRHMGKAALDRLLAHDFPGNVRELENLIHQAAALAPDDEIGPDDFTVHPLRPSSRPEESAPPSAAPATVGASAPPAPPTPPQTPRSLADILAEAERAAIEAAVARTDSLEAAARELDIAYTTLWRKMRRHGLR